MQTTPFGSDIERLGFLLFLVLVTGGLALVAWPFIAPLLWATLAAIMFQPLYNWFKIKRPDSPNQSALAALLVITFAILVPALWIGAIVVEQAALLVVAFQEGEIDVAAWFTQIFNALPEQLRGALRSQGLGNFAMVQGRLQDLVTESAGLIASRAVAIGGSALSWFLAFGVGLYVTFFLLRDGRTIGRTVVRALPLERSIADRLAERFLAIVRATVKGSGVVALVQGVLGAITFWIVGMPSVALFGVLMGIFSLLPAVGPAIVWVPAAIWLLATGAIWQGVVVIISGVAVIGMVDNALRPILVGRDTGIPDWVILVTTLGGIATVGMSGIVVGPLVAGLFLAGWSILTEQRAEAAPEA
ncbi:AI-2E family transporter [Erythrobacter sp. SDW2]|uniref:AI-2E family transporter n=1 Tax=Erythrobacter sp. SDW2 TaxID=2907154 RepID=UPI001F482951|nr:AI-2E family transporter [Erythrobacter sp. SDW2]UIP07550.1 AI-2E family transporter [Erythrobacter sp. SDW2]